MQPRQGYIDAGVLLLCAWPVDISESVDLGVVLDVSTGGRLVSVCRPAPSMLCKTQYVAFARLSRRPNGSVCEYALAFIPFSRDGLSYILDETSYVPTDLTASDLRDTYTYQTPGYEAKLP